MLINNINNEIIEYILTQNDWTIECWSPFEIRHEDSSFATLNAAKIVVEDLKNETPVNLTIAMFLKKYGYNKKCEYFWQDRDFTYSKSGLKQNKNGKTLNNNKYDDFIYSAPTFEKTETWLRDNNLWYNDININGDK